MSSGLKLKRAYVGRVGSLRLPQMPSIPQLQVPNLPSFPAILPTVPSFASSQPAPDPVIEGYVHPDFAPVVDLFSKGFHDGSEAEAQLCVYHGGEKVIDVWGRADPETKYNGDTMQIVFSSSKALTSIVFACLVDR
jgi:CubicO group peptidase (beta-lactamase class C family)